MDNLELDLARQIVEYTHTNLFLTGKAGTGKTTFLRHLREDSSKRMIVLAPTGIAAINAGGVTIHSFFLLPFGPYIPGTKYKSDQFRISANKRRLLRSIDLIVIDEISMVRADLLDSMDAALRRFRDRSKPFGGVQLLLIGDLQQLAPVVTDRDWAMLAPHYATPFFFGSHALQETNFVTIELQKVFRQSDSHFIDLLNAVRTNTAGQDELSALNQRYIEGFRPDRSDGYVRLVTHNHQADQINARELASLTTQECTYVCTISGEFPESSYPTDAQLSLKIGAQVMFVKNDTARDKRYFNGMLGEITALHREYVCVRPLEGSKSIDVIPVEWQNTRYELNEETKSIEETIEGTFRQLPLRIAWAITIHKSQGLTFERAIIDTSSAFVHGQTYVALSRCKSLEGMVLSAPIPSHAIIQDNTVRHFTDSVTADRPTQVQISAMERAFFLQLVEELFTFLDIASSLRSYTRLLDEHFYKTLPETVAIFRQMEVDFREQVLDVAIKFHQQYETLIMASDHYRTDTTIQDRIKKGALYFITFIDTLRTMLQKTTLKTGNKETNKRIDRIALELREALYLKQQLLQYVIREGLELRQYQYARAVAMIGEDVATAPKGKKRREKRQQESQANRSTRAKTTTQTSEWDENSRETAPRTGEEAESNNEKATKKPKIDSNQITLELYKQGFSPEEIAKERGLQLQTIMGHLVHWVTRDVLPVKDFVSDEHAERIRAWYALYPEETLLKDVRNAIGEDIAYHEILIIRSMLKPS